jgi:hypothetical protein
MMVLDLSGIIEWVVVMMMIYRSESIFWVRGVGLVICGCYIRGEIGTV